MIKEEQSHNWWIVQAHIDHQLEVLKMRTQENGDSLGALMVFCGLQTEAEFHQAMVNILQVSCEVLDSASGTVERETLYDDAGEVFGRPDQVELDVIVQEGTLILCEIKSSMSKADMYTFERKVRFYEKRHARKVHRALVISPMVEERARTVAAKLGLEVYSYAEEVPPDGARRA
jgi:hypothetical protein